MPIVTLCLLCLASMTQVIYFAGSVQYLRESLSVETSITVWLVNFGDSGGAYEVGYLSMQVVV